ncbi:class I SAM-dependent methyltransferase [Haloglycomyces albus]|uniref:class I SAM-dependent methyltransferase n=1 Tax=Haloglycomyces albus TaxID=526067 RepID=UPI00046D8DE0|nr:class I SAM-dependent methyltransferase [Haloglycomyces albus]
MKTVKTLADLRHHWDKHADTYDRQITWAERKFFGGTRSWIGNHSSGHTLEVAIGTGLNIPHYPSDVDLTGVELSPRMLEIAQNRAAQASLRTDLRIGDAQKLEFADDTFDTAVCTFSLCTIPDDRAAVNEMIRVLKPGGLLLLADHVVSTSWWVRALQWTIERFSIPFAGEYFRRRPMRYVKEAGLTIEQHARFKRGLIERVAARKP